MLTFSPEAIRKQILEVYDDKVAKATVESLGDDDVRRLARLISRGIHLATPAFDGCKEEQLLDLLSKALAKHVGDFDQELAEAVTRRAA